MQTKKKKSRTREGYLWKEKETRIWTNKLEGKMVDKTISHIANSVHNKTWFNRRGQRERERDRNC